mgnify:CR=1 FL=1
MKQLSIKVLTIITILFLIACNDTSNTVMVPSVKATVKETDILFSEVIVARSNTLKYFYLIQGYDGIFSAYGYAKCVDTFKIDIGKPYKVKFNYVKDKPVVITDLCEMTAILKRDNSNM